MHKIWVSAVGYALPDNQIDQAEICAWLCDRLPDERSKSRFSSFSEHAGVNSRNPCFDLNGPIAQRLYPLDGSASTTNERMLAYAELAPPLAIQAVNKVCQNGSLGHISHIIAVSCTGLMAPGLDISIMRHFGLPNDTIRRAITHQGCYAGITGLASANDICKADPTARVLVISCELSSLHLQLDGADENLVSASLFGDGASAVIVESSTKPVGRGLCIKQHRNELIPDSIDHMAWHVGDHGFSLTLSRFVSHILKADIGSCIERLGFEMEAARQCKWVVHPGGPRILNSIQNKLELAPDALRFSREQLQNGGNRSSGTVLAVLDEASKESVSGSTYIMLAFGPGLTVEAMILEQQ